MARKIKTIVESGESQQSSLDTLVTVIKCCEQDVISKWQEMAGAVQEIYSRKLWTVNYESFEHCMQDAIGWKKSWSYEILKAANVLEHAPITDASMARYLHPLVAENRVIAWEAAVQEASPEKPTREDVKKAVAMLGKSNDGSSDSDESEGEKEPEKQEEVPSIVPPAHEFARITVELRLLKNAIEALAEDPAGAYLGVAQIVVDMKNVFSALKWATPHCVCVYCEGEGCKHCQNRGWMSKGLWDSAPDDMKAQ